jgi:hypothetical protein
VTGQSAQSAPLRDSTVKDIALSAMGLAGYFVLGKTLSNHAAECFLVLAKYIPDASQDGAHTINVTNHGNFSMVYNNLASPDFGKFVGFLYRHEGMTLALEALVHVQR